MARFSLRLGRGNYLTMSVWAWLFLLPLLALVWLLYAALVLLAWGMELTWKLGVFLVQQYRLNRAQGVVSSAREAAPTSKVAPGDSQTT